MDIDKIQAKLKLLDAKHPGVRHSIEAHVFTDHVEFSLTTKENMADGIIVVEGLGGEFDSQSELEAWCTT